MFMLEAKNKLCGADGRLLVEFLLSIDMPHFNAPLGMIPVNIRKTLPLQKLEGLSYQRLKTARSYLHSCGHNTGTWQTDRQTDGIPLASTARLHCEQCRRAVIKRIDNERNEQVYMRRWQIQCEMPFVFVTTNKN